MKIVHNGGLEVFQFESNPFQNIVQGIFSRKGGVSQPPWNSLNQGGTVGDLKEHVVENRRLAFDFFGRSVETLFDVWQVHSTTTICTEINRKPTEVHQKADAIFTNNPEVTLFMRFADCVPIMIYDPIQKVVGIIHAGWKGTVQNIVGEAIHQIRETYRCEPTNLIAAIGPSIGPDHYRVGEEVIDQVNQRFGGQASEFLRESEGHTYLDLWKANESLLKLCGVNAIERADLCTACDIEHWYSHRAEKGVTGRFGALIAL
jgi:YfiH family protein